MKRGLILALMMALMLGAIPALAETPVIKTLPIVVMTNDASDQSTNRSIFRYLNAIDLLDPNRIDWRNPSYATTQYRAYWTDMVDTSGIRLQVGISEDQGWADALSAAEVDNLTDTGLAGFGTAPAAAKNIIQDGNSSLNLINMNALTTTAAYGNFTANGRVQVFHPLNIFNVDIENVGLDYNPSSGVAWVGAQGDIVNDTGFNFLQSWTAGSPLYQADMNDQATQIQLIAAVSSGTRVMPSEPALLEIYSLKDDAGGDHTQQAASIVYHEPDPGTTWNRAANTGVTDLVTPPLQTDPTGKCGFNVLASDNPAGKIMFASWNAGADGSGTTLFGIPGGPSADLTGKLYQAEMRLRSTAATADKTPGYRCEFTNQGYTHFGGIEVTTVWDSQAPSASGDYIATLLWDVPYSTNDMGDAGTLASWPSSGLDYRDYTLLFDLFHNTAGDYGTFTLEEVVVEVIDAPTAPTSSNTYSNYASWENAFIDDPFFDPGAVTKAAGSVTVITDTYNASYGARFAGAFPPIATAAGALNGNSAALNNKVLQLSCTAASPNVETTPICRLYLLPYRSNFASLDELTRNVTYFVMFGALEPFAKFPAGWGGRQNNQPNPGIPPAGGGATLSLWLNTGNGYDETNDYFVPILQVLSLNHYPPTGGVAPYTSGSGWEDNAGGMTCSNVTVNYY